MTLREVLVDAATGLTGAAATADADGSTMWSRAGRAFAALSADGTVASFALDPAVAAAAIRTPDTVPSPRGAGWIEFAPAELDGHATDRTIAWLASAHRRAGPRD